MCEALTMMSRGSRRSIDGGRARELDSARSTVNRLFVRYIQAVLETLLPKFEDAGIEKLMFRSMQPKRAVNGEMAAGSLMVKPCLS